MKKWKIGLVVLGLISAVGCGDSGSGDGDGDGDNTGNGNTDTTSGANAPATNGTDDDAGSTGNTAGGETAGGQTAGGATAGSTAGGSDAGSTTGTPGAGACTNDADTKKLASFDPGATAASCGMMCLADDTCNSCYDKDANFSQVSAPCRTCWVKITRCVADKCVLGGGAPCLLDAAGKACADCRTTNCNPDFVTCSGMDPENP